MTSPPQPRSGGLVDFSLPNPGMTGSTEKRKAINERQRREAAAEEQYLKDLDRIHHDVWPDWGKS